MSTTMKLIEEAVLTANVGSVTFGAGGTLPQDYDDLLLVCSARTDRALIVDILKLEFNGVTTGYTSRYLESQGPASGPISEFWGLTCNGGSSTASTFGSAYCYIPGYSSASRQVGYMTAMSENNAASSYLQWGASESTTVAAVTSLKVVSRVAATLLAGSRISLYGVSRVTAGVSATGGTVTTVDGYKYHTFTSSGSFVVSEPGNVEYLVVAGGGGGGSGYAGGGGAGGLLFGVSTCSAQSYSVVIGSGGAAGSPPTKGTNSSALGFSSAGGGHGSYTNTTQVGIAGGSGGGGAPSSFGVGATAGAGTAGQGNSGGNGTTGNSNTGGGGGAGAVGAPGSGSVGGNGGAGLLRFGAYYAGGGAGAGSSATISNGGLGGGGSTGSAASVNTGGGGGGSYVGGYASVGGNGGSGIVIIRYPVNE